MSEKPSPLKWADMPAEGARLVGRRYSWVRMPFIV